jgi:DNA-binding MurR/RpiR family transcriptional regulator
MSKGHRKIAEYILENYQKASFMTALSLGQTVGVSESTVVRFAMELGFDGYPGFQENLKTAMKSKLTSVQRIELASSQMDKNDVFDKVMSLDIELIRQTKENGDREAFAGAVDAILKAKKIYIVASRSASALAVFLRYYFSIIFDEVVLLNNIDTSDILQRLFRVSADDVVIGISFPRYSKHTNIAMEYASGKGATTIAVTDSMHSPIAKNAKHVLTAGSGMVSFADSLAAPLSLINALIAAVSLEKEADINRSFETLEHLWDEYDVYEKTDR